MAPEPPRFAARRWQVLAALGWLCVTSLRVNPAPPSRWADEFPWSCAQSDGQIITLPVDSIVFRGQVAASVYLPPCYDWTPGKLPVIYLLHGANTDETQWPDVGVQPDADAAIVNGSAPFVVVMPGGPYRYGLDYEDFVLVDLMPGIENRLHVATAGPGRAIGGISLGGYWALKTAFEYPDRFAAVGGHSPVSTYTGGPDDPLALAGSAPNLDQLHITLDVGDLDALLVPTQQLAGALRARGLDVTLSVGRGSHDRPYWRSRTADYLRFYVDAIAP